MLSMSRNVTDLFREGNYYVYGDDVYSRYTSTLLTKHGYHFAGFLGNGRGMNQAGSDYVVISSPEWPSTVEAIGKNCRNVIIFLHPVGNSWGYYDFTKDILSDFEVSDDGIMLPQGVLLEHLVKMNRLKKNGSVYSAHPDHFYSTRKDLVAELTEATDYVASHLRDHESRSIYKSLLHYSPWELIGYFCSRLFSQLQYMDLVSLGKDAVILNGGVGNGFEIPYFLALTNGSAVIHCIDPLGFDYLTDYARKNLECCQGSIFIHELALMNYDGTVDLVVEADQVQIQPIIDDGIMGTDCSSNRTRRFPCTTIDSLVRKLGLRRVDFIKLDLEGADCFALEQCTLTVKTFRPQLAVSIYHTWDDFVSIPTFLIQNAEDYLFFVRHYSFTRSETILYMIPRERWVQPSGKPVPLC